MAKESKELEVLAADSSTSPEKLRELAATYPALRPIIAMNPTSYPGLLDWLAGLNDPAVNVALEQRRATEQAQLVQAAGPQRVSVLQRGQSSDDTVPKPPVVATAAAATTTATAATGPAATAAHVTPAAPVTPTPLQDGSATADRQGEQQQKSSAGYLKAGILAILLIAVGALAVFALTRGQGSPSADEDAVPAQSVSQEAEDSAGEETEEDPLEDEGEETEETPEAPTIVYPAPDQALPLSHIVAPSGNISCLLSADGVICSINSYSFVDVSLANCTNAPATLQTETDGTTVSCSVTPVTSPGATTLSYGDYAANEFGACQSTEYGMTCWNMATGKSFAVARDGFITGTEGMIPISSLPWVG